MSTATVQPVNRNADKSFDPLANSNTNSNITWESTDVNENPTGSTPQDPPVAADPSPTQLTMTRTLTVEIRGSLSKLAQCGTKATWSCDKNASTVFQPSGQDKGFANDVSEYDIKNAVLHEMSIKHVRSTFPCALGVDITGVVGKHYGQDGTPYAKIVTSDSTSHTVERLVEPDEMTNSEYLRKYPGMNRDNLSKVGIVNVPGEDYVFVDCQHPIVEMLQVNESVLQVDMSEAQLIDGRWFKVATQVVTDCTKLLDQQLLQHLPIVDLANFEVSARRLGQHSWDATAIVSDNILADSKSYDSQLERVMTKMNSLTMQIELKYGFM